MTGLRPQIKQVLSNETNLYYNGTNAMIILGGMDDKSIFSSARPAVAAPLELTGDPRIPKWDFPLR